MFAQLLHALPFTPTYNESLINGKNVKKIVRYRRQLVSFDIFWSIVCRFVLKDKSDVPDLNSVHEKLKSPSLWSITPLLLLLIRGDLLQSNLYSLFFSYIHKHAEVYDPKPSLPFNYLPLVVARPNIPWFKSSEIMCHVSYNPHRGDLNPCLPGKSLVKQSLRNTKESTHQFILQRTEEALAEQFRQPPKTPKIRLISDLGEKAWGHNRAVPATTKKTRIYAFRYGISDQF
ncbi:hypothetical protein J6590_091548 [Homalodisca vitripennis]|nr:hypothetical protein J6590_091548 [Homalodisca vitripennis]